MMITQLIQTGYQLIFYILIIKEEHRRNTRISYWMVIEENYAEYILILFAELQGFILAYEFFIVIMII